jgi:hypothetical protein
LGGKKGGSDPRNFEIGKSDLYQLLRIKPVQASVLQNRFPKSFSNDYLDPELKENPPATPLFDRLQRNILASNPRSAVTKMIRIRKNADPDPDPDFT